MNTRTRSTSLFDFYGRPPILKALPLSLQHILAMMMGTVTVPFIIVGAACVRRKHTKMGRIRHA